MPRYFFHSLDGSVDRDTEGTELADWRQARKHAVLYASALLSDDPDVVWHGDDFRIEVTDAEQAILFTVVVFAIDGTALPKQPRS